MRYVFKMLCLSFLPLLPQLNSGSKTNHIRDIKWKHLLGGEPDYNRDTKHESIQLNIFTPPETKQNFALNNYCMRLTMTGSVLFCVPVSGFANDSLLWRLRSYYNAVQHTWTLYWPTKVPWMVDELCCDTFVRFVFIKLFAPIISIKYSVGTPYLEFVPVPSTVAAFPLS